MNYINIHLKKFNPAGDAKEIFRSGFRAISLSSRKGLKHLLNS
jgi:hypothetical protein